MCSAIYLRFQQRNSPSRLACHVSRLALMPISLKDKSIMLDQPLSLSSPAFTDGEDLPRIYTADGSDLSPPLHWNGVPGKTSSFVLFFEDLDSDEDRLVHWLLFNIPADMRGLPAGVQGGSPCLANGSRQGMCWGISKFGQLGYHGPTLTSHRFIPAQQRQDTRRQLRFSLIALDIQLALPVGASPPHVRQEMNGHQLGKASLICLYGCESKLMSCNQVSTD